MAGKKKGAQKRRAVSKAKKVGRTIGLSESGIRLGKVATFGAIPLLIFLPGYKDTSGVTYSIFEALTSKKSTWLAGYSLSQRAEFAMKIGASLLLGKMPSGTIDNWPNRLMCGYLVAGGMSLTVLGKWINAFLGGSFVKL